MIRRDTPLLDPAVSDRMKQAWLGNQECKDYLQAIRVKLDLHDSMDDMDVILNHSLEITKYLIGRADGSTKDLISIK
jgi:hypothetical protein